MTIAVELGTDRLTVTLTDNGRPFNPLDTAAPDTTRSVEERPVGGLGIHLGRQLMDEVHCHRRGGRNVVVLVKREPAGTRRRDRRADDPPGPRGGRQRNPALDPVSAGDRRRYSVIVSAATRQE